MLFFGVSFYVLIIQHALSSVLQSDLQLELLTVAHRDGGVTQSYDDVSPCSPFAALYLHSGTHLNLPSVLRHICFSAHVSPSFLPWQAVMSWPVVCVPVVVPCCPPVVWLPLGVVLPVSGHVSPVSVLICMSFFDWTM